MLFPADGHAVNHQQDDGTYRRRDESGRILSLLGPAVGRMCDELATAAQARPDVSARCEHLARQLRELEQASEDAAERRDDYPF